MKRVSNAFKCLAILGKGLFASLFVFGVVSGADTNVVEPYENIKITAPYYERATYYWETSDGKIFTSRNIKYSHIFSEPGEQWIDLSIEYNNYTTPKTRYNYLVIDPTDKKAYSYVKKTNSEGESLDVENDMVELRVGETLLLEALGFRNLKYDWFLNGEPYSSQRTVFYSFEKEGPYRNLELRLSEPATGTVYDSVIWRIANINEVPLVHSVDFSLVEGSEGLYNISVDATDAEESTLKYKYLIYKNRELYETLDLDSSEAQLYLKKFDRGNEFSVSVIVSDDIGQETKADSPITLFVPGRPMPTLTLDFPQKEESLLGEDQLFFAGNQILTFNSQAANAEGFENLGLTYSWKLNGIEVSKDIMYANNFVEDGHYVLSLTIEEMHSFGGVEVTKEIEFDITNDPLIINTAPEVSLRGIYPGAVVPSGEVVEFYGSAVDEDNDSLKMIWYFGDGKAQVGASSSHVYVKPGDYEANFVVTDGTHIVTQLQKIKVIPSSEFFSPDIDSVTLVESMRGSSPYLSRENVRIIQKVDKVVLEPLLEQKKKEHHLLVSELEKEIFETIRGPEIDVTFWNSFDYVLGEKYEKLKGIIASIETGEGDSSGLRESREIVELDIKDWESVRAYFLC